MPDLRSITLKIDSDACDYVGALARLGGDTELFRDLADIFAIDSGELLSRMQAATTRDDRKGVALAAHSLLGLASTFSAERVTSEAARIETAARDEGTPLVRDFRELRAAVEELKLTLLRLTDDPA